MEETRRAREITSAACYMPVIHNRVGIVQAASWIHAVMEACRSKLRGYHVPLGRGVGYDGCQAGGTSVP